MKPALISLLPLLLAVAGCKTDAPLMQSSPPALSLVGEGLTLQRAPLPANFTAPPKQTFQSLWSGRDHGLFRDLRARNVGDVITVTIDINDKAQFDNQSGRSRQAAASNGIAASLGLGGFGADKASGTIDGSLDMNASSNSKGQGTIDRSEKLQLQIAAVVTEVLPDGNLLISGSQEVRVNREVRVLNIAGIARPLDISRDNVIPYQKIAEARISYGGRGKLSDVQ
jgi:flagellar L-ring protein FlgH